MSLKEQIAADSEVFLNSNEFAEEITYTPSGEASKTIKAVILRYEIAPTEENVYRSLKNRAEVYIANDTEKGITQINKKDDRIMIKDTEGLEHEARVNEVINSDKGMWHLLVGW
jgi:hypothetical protein